MLDESVLIYNGYDVANTLQCKQEIWKATPGIDRTYDFTMRLLDPLMYMMTRGVKVDFEKLDVLRKSLHVQIERKQERLNELSNVSEEHTSDLLPQMIKLCNVLPEELLPAKVCMKQH